MRVLSIPLLHAGRAYMAYYCQQLPAAASFIHPSPSNPGPTPTQTAPGKTPNKLTQATAWASRKWDQNFAGRTEGWRGKVNRQSLALQDKVPHEEWFLKSVPERKELGRGPEVKLLYPKAMMTAEQAMDDLATLVRKQRPYHRRYMIYSALFVPFSCLFTLVPVVPNLPLAYNLFRLYGHYKAYEGAQTLHQLIVTKHISPTPLPALDRILASGGGMQTDRDMDAVLSDAQIAELAREFEAPGIIPEVTRARQQTLVRLKRDAEEAARVKES